MRSPSSSTRADPRGPWSVRPCSSTTTNESRSRPSPRSRSRILISVELGVAQATALVPTDEDGGDGSGDALELEGALSRDGHRASATGDEVGARQHLAGTGLGRDAGGPRDRRPEVVPL